LTASADRKESQFSRNPRGQPGVFQPTEAIMWRIALMSLGILAIALSACEQDVLIAKPGAGDYEVVALVAD
jgi:hypothetical protein